MFIFLSTIIVGDKFYFVIFYHNIIFCRKMNSTLFLLKASAYQSYCIIDCFLTNFAFRSLILNLNLIKEDYYRWVPTKQGVPRPEQFPDTKNTSAVQSGSNAAAAVTAVKLYGNNTANT